MLSIFTAVLRDDRVEQISTQPFKDGRHTMVTVKSSQKIFTEEEISLLTGICIAHLHNVARSKHLGSIDRAAEAGGDPAERWRFTNSDLSVLATLFPRCQH